MPRKARIDAPGELHHIIFRGIERRKKPALFLGGQRTRDNHERPCRQTGIDATGCEHFRQTG